MSFEEWLESTTYNEARKSELREAYDNLKGGAPTKRQCSHIDSFVKTEPYREYKFCRMINSRCDAFKVYSGPAFKTIETEVYKLKPFIKHVPVPERPALIAAMRYAGRRYYATDYTAFESHFTPQVMRAIELLLYKHCLADYPELQKVICRTLEGENKMRTRSGVRAQVQGRRMSGDMCTSLGNGFTNLMLTLFLISEKGGKYEGFVEGDDGLFSTDVSLTSKDYEDLGFTIKIEEVTDPCRASFCGMVFADSGEIVKDPRAVLSSFGWTSSFINAGVPIMKQLLRAKALSLCYEVPQCPILGALGRSALQFTAGEDPRFVEDGYHIMHYTGPVGEFAPSPSTRQLFAELYGVSAEMQVYLEREIAAGRFENIAPHLQPHTDMLHYSSTYLEVG